MPETAQERHLMYVAVRANEKVHAVRELHRQGIDGGGLATGVCQECGKPSPCPTALAVARESDGPCGCGPDCPRNAGTLTSRVAALAPAPTAEEERVRRNAVLDIAQARADRDAVARVRELAERWENALAPDLAYARALLAALDGMAPTPAPSDPGSGE